MSWLLVVVCWQHKLVGKEAQELPYTKSQEESLFPPVLSINQ
jgi:hypothetical protein